MILKSDKRLDAALLQIPRGSAVIYDIGADHGKLSALAVIKGIADYAVATDISALSLDKARKLFESAGLSDKTETRLGRGLEPCGDSGVFVIAGIGGRNIADIIEGRRSGQDGLFITVPHKDARFLREYLLTRGIPIKKDFAVSEKGHFYDVIVADTAESVKEELRSGLIREYGDIYMEYGRDNFGAKNPDFYAKLIKEKNEFDKRLGKVYNSRCLEKLGLIERALGLYGRGAT